MGGREECAALLAWGGGGGRVEGGRKGETGTCTVGEWESKHLKAKTLFTSSSILFLTQGFSTLALSTQ